MIKFIVCADGALYSLSNIRKFWLRPKTENTNNYRVYATLTNLIVVEVVSFGMEVCAIEACNVLNFIKNDPTCYSEPRREIFNCKTDFIGYL